MSSRIVCVTVIPCKSHILLLEWLTLQSLVLQVVLLDYCSYGIRELFTLQ